MPRAWGSTVPPGDRSRLAIGRADRVHHRPHNSTGPVLGISIVNHQRHCPSWYRHTTLAAGARVVLPPAPRHAQRLFLELDGLERKVIDVPRGAAPGRACGRDVELLADDALVEMNLSRMRGPRPC
jgi:hypothetical protein